MARQRFRPDLLSIVVVTHNSERVLGRMLGLLGEELLPSVLVIDNDSRDGTVAVARSLGVRVIQNQENRGYAGAGNQGAAAAAAEVLCFLNPDTEPEPGLIENGCLAVVGTEDRCAVPYLVEDDGEEIPGRQPGYSALKIIRDVLETNYGRRAWRWMGRLGAYHDHTWAWPHGACMFVSRGGFNRVGGMDSRYFMYMEDVEFGWRWSRSGGEVVQLEQRLRHRQRRGSNISKAQRLAHLNRARIQYAATHHGKALALMLWLVTLPSRAVRSGGKTSL
jgi:GT2 family glycosyltransferase